MTNSGVWFVVAISVFACPARADQSVAVVAVDSCEDGSMSPHVAQLRNALGIRRGIRVMSARETQEKLGGVATRSLEETDRLLASARFDVLDSSAVDRAAETFRSLVEDLRRMEPSDDAWKSLREAQVMLAYVGFRQKKSDEAERWLRHVLSVEPDFSPNPDFYPPSFRAWVDVVRKSVKRSSSARLLVDSKPMGKPAFVDGRPIGLTPTVLNVPAGAYRVEVAFGVGGSLVRTIDVSEEVRIEFNRDFEGQVFTSKGPCIGTELARSGRLASMVRLGRFLGVSELIGVRLEEPAKGEQYLVATSVTVADGEETREGKLKLDGAAISSSSYDRLAEFLSTGEASPPVQVHRLDVNSPISRKSGQPSGDGFGTATRITEGRIPAYVATGSGVAAIGLATYFMISAGERQSDVEILCANACPVEATERAENLIAQRNQLQFWGFVAAGVGSASLATALYLFVTDGGDVERSNSSDSITVRPGGLGLLVTF